MRARVDHRDPPDLLVRRVFPAVPSTRAQQELQELDRLQIRILFQMTGHSGSFR